MRWGAAFNSVHVRLPLPFQGTETAAKAAFEKASKSKEAMQKAQKEVADLEAAISKAEIEEPQLLAAKEAAEEAKDEAQAAFDVAEEKVRARGVCAAVPLEGG